MRLVLGTAIALMLGTVQAGAGMLDSLKGIFGAGNSIACGVVDAGCLTDYAAGVLGNTGSDVSVNAYGAALGRMWQRLSPETRDRLLTHFSTKPQGDELKDYVLIARAQVAPDPLSIDDLSGLLEQPDRSGDLPLNYYAETLVLSLLETHPEGGPVWP